MVQQIPKKPRALAVNVMVCSLYIKFKLSGFPPHCAHVLSRILVKLCCVCVVAKKQGFSTILDYCQGGLLKIIKIKNMIGDLRRK